MDCVSEDDCRPRMAMTCVRGAGTGAGAGDLLPSAWRAAPEKSSGGEVGGDFGIVVEVNLWPVIR